jgi:hypothetical protein
VGDQRDRVRSSWRPTWRTIGIVLAVVAGLAGLASVGFIVLMMMAISSYGSNK